MYSNCLFEAIKAKIKDPKNVQIIYLPSRLNVYKGCHFMWTDKSSEEDVLFEFIYPADNKKHNRFLFKGNIVKTSRERFQRAVNAKLNRLAREIEQKYDITINQAEFERDKIGNIFDEIKNEAELE